MSDSSCPNAAGEAIARRSYRIIRDRLGPYAGPPEEEEIVVRVAHATGDIEFARTVVFSPGAVVVGVSALRAGCGIVTDVEMVRSGIRARCVCLLGEPETAELARREAITRSAAAMRRAEPFLRGGIVAIGNAPTALFELMEMIEAGRAAPALVVGVPVGFVGAKESKVELAGMEVPHITNLSERGGSPIAAAIVNGLLFLAFEHPEKR